MKEKEQGWLQVPLAASGGPVSFDLEELARTKSPLKGASQKSNSKSHLKTIPYAGPFPDKKTSVFHEFVHFRIKHL